MGLRPRVAKFVSALVGNWVGIFGFGLAMCSLFADVCLIAIDLFQGFRQPYMGILIYLIVPSIFWIGLIFAGVGVWLERRRRKKQRRRRPALRQVAGGTGANLSWGWPAFSFADDQRLRKLPRLSGD